MKGRITIEIDFNKNNEPYIQVICPADSEDVRDKLLKDFLGKFHGYSNWCSLDFSEHHRDGEARVIIKAIQPRHFEEQANKMLFRAKESNPS